MVHEWLKFSAAVHSHVSRATAKQYGLNSRLYFRMERLSEREHCDSFVQVAIFQLESFDFFAFLLRL